MGNAMFDKLLELRDVADGAETSTASETGVEMPVRFLGNAWVVIYVTAIDFGTEDETYVFSVEISDVVGGSYTEIARIAYLGSRGPGEVSVPISGELADWADDDAAFVRITATLAGTTPSVTYGAYIAPAPRGKMAMAEDLA